MKSVKVLEWSEKVFNQSSNKTEEQKSNTIMLLTFLINNKDPKTMPKGLDKFRIFSRLNKAFQEGEKSKELKLEDGDYVFLKSLIENDIPPYFGMNQDIVKAVDSFLDA